jgi:8-oxo-dGTP pyrophosphatase MutT (NUDIX family)
MDMGKDASIRSRSGTQPSRVLRVGKLPSADHGHCARKIGWAQAPRTIREPLGLGKRSAIARHAWIIRDPPPEPEPVSLIADPTATHAQREVLRLLQAYVDHGSSQGAEIALFREFVGAHADCCERTLAVGHLTGSAWLVSADGARVLLTHHKKLGLWLQLGGHADGDADLARVALREAEEESGLTNLALEPGIFDLDRHWIPERKGEPGHWHYDVRFVVRARGPEEFVVSDESHALAWREIDEVAADESADASVRRMARKWLGRM